MERFLLQKLIAWKNDLAPKPLILRGARQVGKTWLLKEFGRTQFDNVAYIRLEDNEAAETLFEGSLNPERLITGLSALASTHISPKTTLIILDEIQSIPRALTALKYFAEDAPDYRIAVAGSLLGIALHAGISFPVGKVTYLDLYPLSFREFLHAMGETSLDEILVQRDLDLLQVFKEKFSDLLRVYYYVGGMPEAVVAYKNTGDFGQARQVQLDILASYQGDFAKHTSKITAERCRLIFNSIPRHLARENKKFVYGVVKKGARGKDLEDALQFLIDAGLVIKVPRITRAGLPLKAYEDESSFKLFCLDIGILGALSGLESSTIINGNELFTHFKGALAEQYVCQELIRELAVVPYYWSAPKSSGEIDFIIQTYGELIPIEVKAEENLKAKSLASFSKTYGITHAVRLSLSGYREESWMTNIPLYALTFLNASE